MSRCANTKAPPIARRNAVRTRSEKVLHNSHRPLADVLKESERKYRTLFEDSLEAMSLIRDGKIVDVNPAWLELHGYKNKSEVIGADIIDVIHPDDRRLLVRRRSMSWKGRDRISRMRDVRRDGGIVDVEVCSSAVLLGGQLSILSTIRDVSTRKRLEKEILEISGNEQQRLAEDLHDGLGQQLTGIALMSKVLAQKLAAKSLPEAGDATKIVKLANEAIAGAQSLAKGLCPVQVRAEGLMSALRQLAADTETRLNVSCVFRCDVPVLIHDNAVARHLYYIAREAINNAVRHGKAKHVTIELVGAGEETMLRIRDDGVGFPKKLTRNAGLGLHIMKHRASVIGGSLDIQGDSGGGVVVVCTFRPAGG